MLRIPTLGELRFRVPKWLPVSVESTFPRSVLIEEIRARTQHLVSSLRSPPPDVSLYNVVINTPEFSRFVFIVPGIFLVTVSALSLAPPSTLPLIFEKVIPYHIKTIALSTAFHSFIDLAACVLARPGIHSHHRVRVYAGLALAYLSMLASAGLLSLSDYDPDNGYRMTIGLLLCHLVPAGMLPMPLWARAWRLSFLTVGLVSVLTARQKLDFLEHHWDEVVFGRTLS